MPKENQDVRIGINIVVSGAPLSASDIAKALRAQAEALSPEKQMADAKPAKSAPKKGKKKGEEENDPDSGFDSNGAEADDVDPSEGNSDHDASAGEDFSAEESEEGENHDDGSGGEGEEGSADSEPEAEDDEPSKDEIIGLLKKAVAKSDRAKVEAFLKKVTGKDSIHAVDSKKYKVLRDALIKRLK
jgi:ribosomal protein L12E/L44/L45/RPP1/RPP2